MMGKNSENDKIIKKTGFYISWRGIAEAWLCILVVAVALIFAQWPLLSAPNSYYPITVDGMGHLAKIEYIANCLKDFNWPSWFSFWYNGATVAQYYPPLTYFTLAPVQILFDNVMITFKFYAISFLLIGAMGVWYICYRWVGSLVGIIAGIIYVIHPYILGSLISKGTMPQGAIFAISPWLLAATLLLVEKTKPWRVMWVSLAAAALILSHAMHAFVVSWAIGILVLTLFLLKRIEFRVLLIWIGAVGLGATLVSFWWIPGVTHLENPAIPYMLPGNWMDDTADLRWFTTYYRGFEAFHYFSPILLLLAMASLIFFKNTKNEDDISFPAHTNPRKLDINDLRMSGAVSLLSAIILSMGNNLPFFKYVPFHEEILAGRFLSYAAIIVAILAAIFLRDLWEKCNSGFYRILRIILIAAIAAVVMVDINPRLVEMRSEPFQEIRDDLSLLPSNGGSFDNGRISWLMVCGPETTYFPMTRGYNVTTGWNIEGTPHNRAIWLHNIAIAADCGDYVLKNLLQWNSRSVFIQNDFFSAINSLTRNGFNEVKRDQIKTMFISNSESSYLYIYERNAIAIGKSSPGLIVSFPWLVQGRSNFLEDYSIEEMSSYNLIYLSQPEIKDSDKFTKIVEELAEEGKIVVVEMEDAKPTSLLGVIPYMEPIAENAQLVPTEDSLFNQSISLNPITSGQFPAMGNLDEVWMEMQSGGKRVPVIGSKKVGSSKVYFVGMTLGLHLDSELKWSRGLTESSYDSSNVKSLLEKLMDLGNPNKEIIPKVFPVSGFTWDHKSFCFDYNSQEPLPIMISVTYTPRWKATLDGIPLEVKSVENLILIDLPAGQHTVEFNYGLGWVGWLGIGMSLLAILMLLIICWRWEYLMGFFDAAEIQLKRAVESIGG
ncbi:MAG: 6-pyruvoyl-tetrahydropterin synthase-related protein [Syntrophomonas sp.]|nr:6-pyruvoyl-tetrahydropterin synthase-related protein [Syntrophomonas sp.]